MDNLTYTAFRGYDLAATGSLEAILRKMKALPACDGLLIFEDQTGKQIDFDMRGSMEEILARVMSPQPKPGPGRPKLGVTSREISLLPRHWEWLETQPQGASAALRRLVEEARKRDGGESATRARMEAIGRVMTAVGGNLPDFEEAYRALYARDREGLIQRIQDWPRDLRNYILGE